MTVSTTINRKEVTCTETTASFTFPYVTFSASDIKVYRNGTLQSQADPNKYNVTLDSNFHATITFQNSGTDYRPVADDKIIIVREVATTQTTNYVNNSIFDAETLERSIDLEAIKSQQLTAKGDRAIKFADDVFGVSSTTTDLTTGGTDLNNKILGFNNDGNITATVELGTNRGNWASGSTYVLRDLVKQNNASHSATYGNIYICKVAHTAGGSHVTDQDSAKWDLIVDVATATTNATTATTQAGLASDHRADAAKYAVTAENSSFTLTATNSGTSGLYSAKHYQEKAKEWAGTGTSHPLVTDDSGSNIAGEYSAKAWASKSTGTVDGSTRSAKVSASDAKKIAINAHSSQYTLDDSTQGYSALHYATEASTSATNASASEVSARNSAAAVASALDSFDDKYLGTMSDSSTQGTNPTPTGTWAKDSSSITVSSGANIKVGQVVTGTGMPSPPPNVLSVTGSGSSETVVVSASMAGAGSSVSLTFTGYGVYGTYNSTKDGPTSDNDNGSLADGMLYFNTTDNQMMVYKTTGAKWIPASSTGSTSLLVHKFTASGSETSVSASSFSPTLTYTPANIIVFLNGVRLDATDYTATNGNDITGLSALSASDEVVVYAFKSFEVADVVSASSGGTFSGNVAVTGNVSATGNIQVDDIIEKSTGHGVEIEQVTLKDGGGTFTENSGITKSNDGGDVELSINNSAGSGSTDETVTIKAGQAGTVGGKIVFARHGNYSSTGDKSSTLNFYTADDNSDQLRMHISKGGNVGIGVDSPLGKIHAWTASAGGSVTYNAGVDELLLENSGDCGMTIMSGATNNGAIWFGKTGDNGRGRIDFDQNDGKMSLWTANTERLSIDNSGNAGISTTTPASFITRSGTGRGLVIYNPDGGDTGGGANEACSAELILAAAATNTQCVISFNDNVDSTPNGSILYDLNADDMYFKTGGSNTTRLLIASNGNFTGSSSADISDQRLKENITDLTNSLEKISQLRGVSYTWKKEANKDLNVPYYGLLAQELEAIIPELVWNHSIHDTEELKYKSIHMTGLIPVLVEAVKELSAKVEALENA